MGCRKEEEDRFWGRLGSEAGLQSSSTSADLEVN